MLGYDAPIKEVIPNVLHNFVGLPRGDFCLLMHSHAEAATVSKCQTLFKILMVL